ncbi:reverse transcriptase, partial [Phytophthora megakarya]
MDFVIQLPKSRRGNTALLLWQCAFTGFVIAKAMSETDALTVAKVFEESIYRRFEAPSLIRHDRDPRFMKLIQARSRSTLSYRPQANGQQERSVKTVTQTVNVYVEGPLQQDWDEIAERLVCEINNSHDMTRKETPFYLVHGWDAHTTLRAMTTSRGVGKQTEALAWRREINRQHQIALEMAKEYQATEKARRTQIHNDKLSRKEHAT